MQQNRNLTYDSARLPDWKVSPRLFNAAGRSVVWLVRKNRSLFMLTNAKRFAYAEDPSRFSSNRDTYVRTYVRVGGKYRARNMARVGERAETRKEGKQRRLEFLPTGSDIKISAERDTHREKEAGRGRDRRALFHRR